MNCPASGNQDHARALLQPAFDSVPVQVGVQVDRFPDNQAEGNSRVNTLRGEARGYHVVKHVVTMW